jgi:hypothetical protein
VTRRQFTASAISAGLLQAAGEPVSLRGKLTQNEGRPPLLTTPGGKQVAMLGDEQTRGVLSDARLKDAEFEIVGAYDAAGVFEILPIHKRALFVHRDGKRLYVTYWCAVCAIRTYTPGMCWCCQDETALDLKERLDVD